MSNDAPLTAEGRALLRRLDGTPRPYAQHSDRGSWAADIAAVEAAARQSTVDVEALRETVKATTRSMDEWLGSSDTGSPDDRTAIRAWSSALDAALAESQP